jgi:lipopolysaccharide biosynthesis glycosyltransferase
MASMKSATEILAESLAALAEHGEDADLRYHAGRACVDLDQIEDARAHLDACRGIEPGHQQAALELARVEFRSGHLTEALTCLDEFLAGPMDRLTPAEQGVSEQILDQAFPTSPRKLVSRLYLRIAQLGSARHLTIVRAFTGAVAAKQWSAAGSLLEIMSPPQRHWEHMPLATYYRQRGEHDKAEHHALAAGADQQDSANVAKNVVKELVLLGRFETAKAFIAQARERFSPQDLECLEFERAVEQGGDVPDFVLACESAIATAPRFAFFLEHMGERLQEDQCERVYAALERRFPGESALRLSMSRVEVRQRRYPRATELANLALVCAKDEPSRLRIRFHLFQIACQANLLDVAADLYAVLPLDELNSGKLIFVSQYLAEAGKWQEAFEVLLRGLRDCQEVTPQLLHHAIRTASQAKKRFELLDSLSRRTAEPQPTVRRLAIAVFEDWAAAEGRGHPEALALARKLQIEITPLLEFKLSILAPQWLAELRTHLPADRVTRRAVFYCADSAYILPSLVSLTSLLNSNQGFHADTFYLVVEDELLASTQAVLDHIAHHFRVRTVLQQRSELVSDVSSLKTTWGHFSGGRGLSPAAYYRIYMARKLAASGDYGQLLYLDSDTIVSHGFQDLLALPVAGDTLLMAAPDQDIPGIHAATRRHGLVQGRYFNSGMLWFPRVNAALVERLLECERVIVEHADQMMFLDQCALNIAFASVLELLPRRFNFLIPPKDAELLPATPAADACLLHLLESPKPWHSSYPDGSMVKPRWLDALHELHHVVGDDLLRPLFEATFR